MNYIPYVDKILCGFIFADDENFQFRLDLISRSEEFNFEIHYNNPRNGRTQKSTIQNVIFIIAVQKVIFAVGPILVYFA